MKSTSTRSTPRRPFAGARVRDGSRSDRNRQIESKHLSAQSDDNEVHEAIRAGALCLKEQTLDSRSSRPE